MNYHTVIIQRRKDMINFNLSSLSNTFLPVPKCVNFAKLIKDLLVMVFKGLSHILKISD